ncbi:manganese transporter [Shouchella clausii]|nr:manganese transporter [Shouchella clausii]
MEKQQEPPRENKAMLKDKLKAIGPGAIVTASFIGPGTVTTATRAGASFGFALLWAIIFSIIATIVLQEMCARLGIITQKGLGAAIREHFTHPLLKYASMFLVLVAILVGSSAYMAGDLLGTSMGISTLTGLSPNVLAPLFGIVILALGLSGSYKLVEKLMIALVVIMSITFITTMVVAKPPLGELFQGAFLPTVPDQSIIMIIALIGTTVVPYNLFLHSENVIERWNKPTHLADSRWDIVISISVGGLITAAILITSATMVQGMEVKNVSDLSVQLEPLLGSWALVFTSIGLFAAGFTSALASPLGAAITASSILKWSGGMRDKRFKIVFSAVILFGVVSSSLGFEPLDVLLFAQALNGILLPFVSIMLLIIMNNKNRLGNYVNSLKMNVVGGIVVALCTGLGLYSFVDAVRAFFG